MVIMKLSPTKGVVTLESHHLIVERKSNTAASLSIVFAVIGFILSLIPLLGWFSLPVWILAILFGVIGVFKQYKRGSAISGIVIGLLTFIYKIFFIQVLFS
jgi:thiamine transporter ThiT